MRLRKQDLVVTYEHEGCYRILIRTKFLWFFYRWVPITYQEAEHLEDKILEFETFKAATEFIELVGS